MYHFYITQKKLAAVLIFVACFSFVGIPRAEATLASCAADVIVRAAFTNVAERWIQGKIGAIPSMADPVKSAAAAEEVAAAALVAAATATVAAAPAAVTAAAADALISVPTFSATGVALQTDQSVLQRGILLSTHATAIETTAHNLNQDVGRPIADTIAYTLAQCALDTLTENTITWIKGGFHGNPGFATNPGQLFRDLASGIAGSFSTEIGGLSTCVFPGFNKNDFANSLKLSGRDNASGKFALSVSCGFPTDINSAEFYNDFSKGGWKGFEASLSDRNNSFGFKMMANQELATRQEEARSTQEQKLNHSNGFLDLVDTSSCDGMPGDVILGINDGTIDGQAKTIYEQTYCKTTTPGKMISERLSKTLGTDMDRLGLADNMNKIFNELIKTFISSAIHGVTSTGRETGLFN